jgi:hypothetical protein
MPRLVILDVAVVRVVGAVAAVGHDRHGILMRKIEGDFLSVRLSV